MLANNNDKKFNWERYGAAFLSLSLLLCLPSNVIAQKTKRQTVRREETPNERFIRKGGREIKAEITSKQNGEITANIISDQRDLKLYDQAGHFDCRGWSNEALKDPRNYHNHVESLKSKAGEFIWEHWQTKKRGYLRITFNSVDATGTSHIFIEPDSQGVWQIVWRIARWHALGGHGVTDLPIIRRLEQTKGNDGKTVLKFKDADGEEWQSL